MIEINMINSMPSKNFGNALDIMNSWGIKAIDLKDQIFEKKLLELSSEEAEKVAAMISERGQYIYCLSTSIFQDDIEKGEFQFREIHEKRIDKTKKLARILNPRAIRVLSAQTSYRHTFKNSIEYLRKHHQWIFTLYREAIDELTNNDSWEIFIENDPSNNIFGSVEEILEFFDCLNRPNQVKLTFDIQNLWCMGVFPTLEVYKSLKPLIGYIHVKGGIKATNSFQLKWKSSLEDASWPVAEIIRQAVLDGVTSVISLNPSHGEVKPDYDYTNIIERDLEYLRRILL